MISRHVAFQYIRLIFACASQYALLLGVVPLGAQRTRFFPASRIDGQSRHWGEDATLKIYPGADHGLISTHKDQFNADLLSFLRS